jgi:enoyl-CoA hydratase/carnithine racemase
MAPLAVQASKEAMTQGLRGTFDEAAAREIEMFSGLFATEDAKEGCDAFVGKRPAEWTGR